VGRKKQPSFRIVVAGGMHARSGRVTETIGKYNPRTEPSFIEVDEKRALYWLGKGAQMSGKVESLFRETGIMKKLADGVEGEGVVTLGVAGGKTNRPPKPSAKKAKKAEAEAAVAVEEAPAPEAAAEETPVAEAAAEEAPVEEAAAEETPAAEAAAEEASAAEVAEAPAAEAEEAPVAEAEEQAAPAEAEAEATEEKKDEE
jgi:small subunit ribosomal protein S16